jgi:hypothetical protein
MAQPLSEAAVDALLREQARRQAMVDRLVGTSAWSRFAAMQLPAIAMAAVFAIVLSLLGRPPGWLEGAAILGLTGVVWLSIELVQVTLRLQAVTSILKETGALTDFVERSVPRLVSAQ